MYGNGTRPLHVVIMLLFSIPAMVAGAAVGGAVGLVIGAATDPPGLSTKCKLICVEALTRL